MVDNLTRTLLLVEDDSAMLAAAVFTKPLHRGSIIPANRCALDRECSAVSSDTPNDPSPSPLRHRLFSVSSHPIPGDSHATSRTSPRVHTLTMMVVAYDAWRMHGTLRKAGAQLQLSHERVRQLVRQAVANGLVPALFPKDLTRPLNPFCDRATTIHLLQQYGTTVAISRLTGCSLTRLRHQVWDSEPAPLGAVS